MKKFNLIKTRKIAVVPLDRRVQITYKHHTVEYPFDMFVVRTVADFDECSMFIRRTFKEMFSPLFLWFGRLDVYVTVNPLIHGCEIPATEDVFRICRCVKKVHLVYCSTAAAVGMGLPDKTDCVIFDLDKESCYVSVFESGIIVDVEEMWRLDENTVNWKTEGIMQFCSHIFESRNYNVYLVGSNDNIAQFHSALEKKMNREIILFESNTVISEGLDKIMSQEIHDAICYPKCR